MKIYSLKQIESTWGDYGDILISGMSGYSERIDGSIQLYRTGPFIPPITFPGVGDVVVTDDARRLLESSGLTGFSFLPVVKRTLSGWIGSFGTKRPTSQVSIRTKASRRVIS